MRWGVVDLIAALPDDAVLESALRLPEPGTVPVVGVQVLVLMKLQAGRTQDQADIEHLAAAGMDIRAVLEWLSVHAPDRVPAFSRIVARALREP